MKPLRLRSGLASFALSGLCCFPASATPQSDMSMVSHPDEITRPMRDPPQQP
jgi:hypothetical protein